LYIADCHQQKYLIEDREFSEWLAHHTDNEKDLTIWRFLFALADILSNLNDKTDIPLSWLDWTDIPL